jgi:hypothetical protein
MTRAELRDTVHDMNEQVQWILENQRRRANIAAQLARRNANPLEEDFIEADLMGSQIGVPSRHVVDGVEVIVRKLHRRGASAADIAGADLLYEITGEKFVVIQYKTPDSRHRVSKDEPQIEQLTSSCSNPCPPRPVMFYGCGAWHAVRNGRGYYHPACLVSEIFDKHKTRSEKAFLGGFSKRDFDLMFARCLVGAPVREGIVEGLAQIRVEEGRLVVLVTQQGRF